jgi:hypothetical protein
VSSRREEKERRRAERIAAEEEAAKGEARRRTVGIAVGAVLGMAAVAAIVIAVTAGGGGGDGKTGATTTPKVPIPAQKTTDLRAAASAAGCQLRSFTPGPRDREHVTTRVRYKQNPPVFGPHYPEPAHDGNYVGQGAPTTEKLVHALEHARVIIWYRPAIGDRPIRQLETLFSEPFGGKPAGYKQILVERSDMPFAVAATTWGQQLGCPRFNENVFDALRAFRATYVDKAPESNIPFPE